MRGETIGNHIIKPSRIRKSINATSGFVRRPRLWVKVNCLLVARGRIQDTYIYIYIYVCAFVPIIRSTLFNPRI